MSKRVLFTASVQSHIGQFHMYTFDMLKSKGYHIDVAARDNLSEKSTLKIDYADEIIDVPFERNPLKKSNLKAYRILKKLIAKNDYSVIHCNTPVVGVLTRIAAKRAKSKAKVIYTAHGFHFFKGAPLKNRLIYYPSEHMSARLSDAIITINKEDYKTAQKFKLRSGGQVHYIHGLGVDTKKFISQTEEKKTKMRKELGIDKDSFVVFMIGELNENKNQDLAIKAINFIKEKIPNIKLYIAGNGPREDEYKSLIRKLDLEICVKMLGYTRKVSQYMLASDVFASCSKREGLPISVLEAMATGLPMVVTDCRGNRDLVSDGRNGFVVSTSDHIFFGEKIEKFYFDKSLTEKFRKKSYEVLEDYKKESVIPEIEKVYDDIEDSSKKKYLIVPNCSDHNRGDQALVWETKRCIEELDSNAEFWMLSDKKASDQSISKGILPVEPILKHPSRFNKNRSNIIYGSLLKIQWGIVAVWDLIITSFLLNPILRKPISVFLSKNSKETLELYRACDAVFVKGGGFIHAYGKLTDIYYIFYVLFHINLAHALKKKVFIFPNSFGPIEGRLVKRMVKNCLSKCAFVSTREKISKEVLKNSISLDIKTYPDLGFFLKTDKKFDPENFLPKELIQRKNKVAITVRPYRFNDQGDPKKKYLDYKKAVSEFIVELIGQDYVPVLVQHSLAKNHHEDDKHCMDEILEMVKGHGFSCDTILTENLNCTELKKIYSRFDYLIGTRFHSVIFALSQNIPSISIAYGGNKSAGIMKDMGLSDYVIPIESITFDRLKSMFENLVMNKEMISNRIDDFMKKSEKDREIMIDIIGNKLQERI